MQNAHANPIAAALLDIGALRFSPDKPYKWSSGWLSPVYCDNRLTLSYPVVRQTICNGFIALAAQHNLAFDVVCGVATGGVPHGMLMADRLNKPFVYVRPTPKSHGLGNQVEGKTETGQKVLVIEDLISTGKSSLQAVLALRAQGMQVVGILSIFTYGFDVATRLFADHQVPTWSLCNLETLLAAGQSKNLLQPQAMEAIRNWRTNPEAWSAAHVAA
jgi:orotate phosphoribosyltransferase